MSQGKYYNKIFILVTGEVEIYFDLKKKIINIENLSKRGQVLNELSCITLNKIKYSAKAVESCSFLTISLADLQDIMLRRKDLRKRIDKTIAKNEEAQYNLMIDYTRGTFYEKDLEEAKL